MTHISPNADQAPRGNGRIRKALPVLGLIATAISGLTSQSDGSQVTASPERTGSVVTVQMIAEEATLLHYARAQGVGDAIRETGIPFPDQMNEKLGTVRDLVNTARTESTGQLVDMAYSSGYLDALEGGWDLVRLERYVDTIYRTERGILELADQATLRWAGEIGLEDGRSLITGAIALTVSQDHYAPIWSGTIGEDPVRANAFVEVSGAVRRMLDAVHEAAYVPPPFPGPGPDHAGQDVTDPFRDATPSGVCAMEI
jgi:hypothetical protein